MPGPPTLEEYVGLRARSGLTPVTSEQGAGAVAHGWSFCHVRDVATGPYVTLNADAPGRRLYESLGFVETAPHTVAMRLPR